MHIDEALEHYLTQLQGDGRSKHTVDQARRHVRLFAAWLASTEHGGAIEIVHHEDLARFCASSAMRLRADGGPRKATSANALRSSLRAFFAYTHLAGYAPTNAARLIRRARCGRANRPGLQDSELLLAALNRAEGSLARRDRVLFTLMLRTGVRVGSTVAIDVGDVDLDGGTITLTHMKNNDQDLVFLPREIVAMLREYIGDQARGPLFVGSHGGRISVRQVGRRLWLWIERAGLAERFGPHRLRHEFACVLLRRTGNIAVVQRALHHKSIASTLAYVRVGDDAVRAAIEA